MPFIVPPPTAFAATAKASPAVVAGSFIANAGISLVSSVALGFLQALLFPPKDVRPNLTDFKVQGVSEGDPVPRTYGTEEIAGQIIAKSAVRQIESNQDVGKGGGGKGPDIYEAQIDLVVGLGEGIVAGIGRIKANGNIIANYLANNKGPSLKNLDDVRFYNGDFTQTPDPLVEEIFGVNDAMAWRGLSYVILEGFRLGDYGNTVPNITVEVIRTGNSAASFDTLTGLAGWQDSAYVNRETGSYQIYSNPGKYYLIEPISKSIINSNTTISGFGGTGKAFLGEGEGIVLEAGLDTITAFSTSSWEQLRTVGFPLGDSMAKKAFAVGALNPDTNTRQQLIYSIYTSPGQDWVEPLVYYSKASTSQVFATLTLFGDLIIHDANSFSNSFPNRIGRAKEFTPGWDENGDLDINPNNLSVYLWISSTLYIVTPTSGGRNPTDTSYNKYSSYGTNYVLEFSVTGYGYIMMVPNLNAAVLCNIDSPAAEMILISLDDLSVISSSSIILPFVPNRQCFHNGGPDWDGRWIIYGGSNDKDIAIVNVNSWEIENTYDLSTLGIGTSNFGGGVIWNADLQAALTHSDSGTATFYRIWLDRVSPTATTLDTIVEAEVTDGAVLTSADIDVTSLSSVVVDGWTTGGIGPIRNSIAPLQITHFFDIVESDYLLKFVLRGSASVATLSYNNKDLAIRVKSTDNKVIDDIITKMVDEIEVPWGARLRHAISGETLERGEAQDNFDDGITLSKEVVINETTEALTGDAAAAIVTIQLESAKLSSETYSVVTHLGNLKLDPTDVITVIGKDGISRTIRITKTGLGQDLTYQIEGVLEDPDLYALTRTGLTYNFGLIDTILPSNIKSFYLMFDAPDFNESESAGLFAVAAPTIYTLSTWKGVVIYTKPSSGAWNEFKTILTPVGYGTLVTPPGDNSQWSVWDRTNTFRFRFYGDPALLISVSELDVLNRLNSFFFGGEVIQATTITQVEDNTYDASNLLRARLGTDWAIGSHVAGEDIILLNSSTLRFATVSSNYIGQDFVYRGATIGADNSNSFKTLNYKAANITPYSPAFQKAILDTTTFDINLTWFSRTTVHGDWRDLVDAPVDPVTDFEIDVYDNQLNVVNTIVLSDVSANANYIYTRAQQVADGVAGDLGLAVSNEITLVNPDAETGDKTGWTDEIGSWAVNANGPPIQGSWAFGAGSSPINTMYQEVDLAAVGISTTDIDNDKINLLLTFLVANQRIGVSENVDDTFVSSIEFLDVSHVTISTASSPAENKAHQWIYTEFKASIPATARYARIKFTHNEISDPGRRHSVDDIHLYWGNPSPNGITFGFYHKNATIGRGYERRVTI